MSKHAVMAGAIALANFAGLAQADEPPSPWVENVRLLAVDGYTNDYLGVSAALSSDGRVCAAGAHASDPGGITNAGAVYIFTNFNGVWRQSAKLFADDRQTNDYLGTTIALNADGTVCAVGTRNATAGGTNKAGAVYIFTNFNGVWSQAAKLFASDRQTNDYFGVSVALSKDGGICAAGASEAAAGGTNAAGAVYIFTNHAGSWAGVSNEAAKLFATDRQVDDSFGQSVALDADGGICAVGAYEADVGGLSKSGAAYVFTNHAGGWAGISNETTKLLASDRTLDDWFGRSVALNSGGSVCAVGSRYANAGGTNNAGAVYIFTNTAGNWAGVSQEAAKLFASDRRSDDWFGDAVALNADGNACAVGASYADPDGKSNAGAAYIFTNMAGSWAGVSNESCRLLPAGGAVNDWFGSSVALDADGKICAVGATGFDMGGTSSVGAAYVFAKPFPYIVGTNGGLIASDAAAGVAHGTDFGVLAWGGTTTHLLAITNAGLVRLNITGCTTSGASAAAFQIAALPGVVAPGAVSNFTVTFQPSLPGAYAMALHIANNSTLTPYVLNLAGTGGKKDQTINFTAIPDQDVDAVVSLNAMASSGLAVSFTATVGSPVRWISANTIAFNGLGTVRIVAAQPGDADWNPAPDVTNSFVVTPAAPPAPGGVSATDGAYTDKVRVTWNAVAGATSYQVWRHTTNDSSAAGLVGNVPAVDGSLYDDAAVALETTYYYWVKAVNAGGASAFSAPDTGYPGVVGPLVGVNGLIGDNARVNAGTPLTITVEMMNLPAGYIGNDVDWWLAAYAHNGGLWYYLNNQMQFIPFDGNLENMRPAYQGPLADVPPYTVARDVLVTPGVYNIWFAVDYPMDGVLHLTPGQYLMSRVTLVVE